MSEPGLEKKRKGLVPRCKIAEEKIKKDNDIRERQIHSQRKTDLIFMIYILGILLWAYLINYLNPPIEWMGILILFLPFIAFFITLIFTGRLNLSVENTTASASLFLTAGLVIIIPLLTLITKDFNGDKELLMQIVVLGVFFALLSILDVWVPEKWVPLLKHVRSIFQNMFFTLIIFAIYFYYYHGGFMEVTYVELE